MSIRSIQSSVRASLFAAFGLFGAMQSQAWFSEPAKHKRYRNNYQQKTESCILRVRRNRQRNKIAKASRRRNRA